MYLGISRVSAWSRHSRHARIMWHGRERRDPAEQVPRVRSLTRPLPPLSCDGRRRSVSQSETSESVARVSRWYRLSGQSLSHVTDSRADCRVRGAVTRARPAAPAIHQQLRRDGSTNTISHRGSPPVVFLSSAGRGLASPEKSAPPLAALVLVATRTTLASRVYSMLIRAAGKSVSLSLSVGSRSPSFSLSLAPRSVYLSLSSHCPTIV